MTGGQTSPTTPFEMSTSSSPYGNAESPFDICHLVEAAGAAFVARSTVYHVRLLEKLIKQALHKKGFSVVEVVSHCPIHVGKQTGMSSPVEMMKWQKEHTIPVGKTTELPIKDLRQKIITGLLANRKTPTYGERYQKLIDGIIVKNNAIRNKNRG
jgi:2-oxoglutarate ferredoxin oxidoreductase subunit beta